MATKSSTPAKPAKPAEAVSGYQLLIELEWVEPPVWRRVVVPSSVLLIELHQIIQVAMGWENQHLHEFQFGRRRFRDDADANDGGDFFGEGDDRAADVYYEIELKEALGARKSFTYTYDFGDDWRHNIKVEKILRGALVSPLPLCVDGAGACPPEDCGGAGGYSHLLEALADPKHGSHAEMRDWVGDVFDPTLFDIARVNQSLSQFAS